MGDQRPAPGHLKPKVAPPPRTPTTPLRGTISHPGGGSPLLSPPRTPPHSPSPAIRTNGVSNSSSQPHDSPPTGGVRFATDKDDNSNPSNTKRTSSNSPRPTNSIQVAKPSSPQVNRPLPTPGTFDASKGQLNRSLSDQNFNKKQTVNAHDAYQPQQLQPQPPPRIVSSNGSAASPKPSPPARIPSNTPTTTTTTTPQQQHPPAPPARTTPATTTAQSQPYHAPAPPPRTGRRTHTAGPGNSAGVMPNLRPLPSPPRSGAGSGGPKKMTNFDQIWNEFQKMVERPAPAGQQQHGAPGMGAVDKLKRFGRMSGKFSSPLQVRRTAHFVCNKMDTLKELLNRNNYREFIGEVGDLLVHLNSISAGLKEMDFTAEKQLLIEKIRAFVLASNDRVEGHIDTKVWQDKAKGLTDHLRKIQSMIPEITDSGSIITQQAPIESSSGMEDKEKQERLRQKALEELMFSEKAYLLQLLTLSHTLVDPLKREESKISGLKGTEFWTILSFLRPIVDITKKLVKDFARATRENKPIGEVFLGMAPVLKMYVSYINSYDAAIESMGTMIGSSADFKRIIDRFLETAEHPTVDFYLILPIQRLPRYEMLLKEILKYTEENNEDWGNLQAALAKVKETNDFVNEKKREDQSRRQLADIQNSIISKEPLVLVQRGRVLVKEGTIYELNNKKKKPYYYFLFNDLLIKTKIHSYDKKTSQYEYKFVKKMTLNHVNVIEMPPSSDDVHHMCSFLVTEEGGLVNYMYCLTQEEKQEWFKAVEETIALLKSGGSNQERRYISVGGDDAKG